MCGNRIKGNYLKAGDEVYCSQPCYRKSLPLCSSCGKPIEGKYLAHEGRRYCSETCFNLTLPQCTVCNVRLKQCFRIDGKAYCKTHADAPRCEACGMPAEPGVTLDDGRRICTECQPQLVFSAKPADKLYRKAASAVRRVVAHDLPLIPPLHLTGRGEFPAHDKLPKGASTSEQGRYVRETDTTTISVLGMAVRSKTEVQKKILILYGLTQDRFLSTAAHELMHDIISERYPGFDLGAPDWAEEGVCQYAAALVCRRLGLTDRLKEIEEAEDPIYGDGYRYMVRVFGQENWQGVARWMGQDGFSDLPAHAH